MKREIEIKSTTVNKKLKFNRFLIKLIQIAQELEGLPKNEQMNRLINLIKEEKNEWIGYCIQI